MVEETAALVENLADQLRRARSGGGAFALPSRVLIRLSGKDAFRYLQGQVTRDLNRLTPGEAFSACLLTPKGKLSVPLLVWRDGEDLLLEADSALQENLVARLERYIVADDVTLSEEARGEGVHVFGDAVTAFAPEGGIRTSRLGVPGLDLNSTHSGPSPALLDPLVVEVLRIERGLPAWGRELDSETLPPEAGLDRTHIDYDRGCYPGQETISRLRSVGRARRLLHTLISEPGIPLPVGMKVVDASAVELGEISSSAEQFDTGRWVALAILPRATRETSELVFAADASVPLTDGATRISIAEVHGS